MTTVPVKIILRHLAGCIRRGWSFRVVHAVAIMSQSLKASFHVSMSCHVIVKKTTVYCGIHERNRECYPR